MDPTGSPAVPLSVVVVNWNGAGLLPGCLEPLRAAGVETIVVDNGSSDASLDLLAREFPWAVVVANPDNRGFAVANNQGLAVATEPNVLLLNNDTLPNREALAALASFLAGHPEVAVVGPSLAYADGRRQPSCGPGPNLWTEILAKTLLHRVLPGLRAKAPEVSCRVDWVTGAALCIRREVAAELGGLDESMFMFYEDLDLCARVREAGHEVWFVATPPITHLGGASRRRVEAKSLVDSYHSADRFFGRHGPAWRRGVLRAMIVPEMALRSGVWGLLSLSPGRRVLARERLAAYRSILGQAVRPGRSAPGPAPLESSPP